MNLLAIDPGLDGTGWAILRIPAQVPINLGAAISHLRLAGDITTKPADAMEDRLGQIHGQLVALLHEFEPERTVLELPSYHGSYAPGDRNRRSVNSLYQAVGAIRAALHGREVIDIRAPTTAKLERHVYLQAAANIHGIQLPTGPQGGKREDAWDAIWIGCQAILAAPMVA